MHYISYQLHCKLLVVHVAQHGVVVGALLDHRRGVA